MADNARGIHVSPNVYSREIELNYAVKSLGITTLGVVGETLKGPAFQPMRIENWREFQDVFGGTSTEKFSGSQYPKYELPYIAKSYLTESNQLEVCRVLGLSGYNAGPAWLITDNKNQVIAVLRSRGHYEQYVKHGNQEDTCNCTTNEYDKLVYNVGEIKQDDADYCLYARHFADALIIDKYQPYNASTSCKSDDITGGDELEFTVSPNNYGYFRLKGINGEIASIDIVNIKSIISGTIASDYEVFDYAVSLNPSDKDYILNVLGTDPHDGSAPIYVEALYDVAFQNAVDNGSVSAISSSLTFVDAFQLKDFAQLKPANAVLTKNYSALTRKDLNKRFLATESDATNVVYQYDIKGKGFAVQEGKLVSGTVTNGDVYTVRQYTDEKRIRHYYYTIPTEKSVCEFVGASATTIASISDAILQQSAYMYADKLQDLQGVEISASSATRVCGIIDVIEEGKYYKKDTTNAICTPIETNLNDYRSAYRYASTPWIVSNIKGDYKHIELNKLFRFHTISDGTMSNYEFKVSIVNVRPDEGTFTVIVRDINDTDDNVKPLETFSKCTLKLGDSRYIGYMIGTYDGAYESKSKYITVEVNEEALSSNSVPCGFLGYPQQKYNGEQIYGKKNTVKFPEIAYNTIVNDEIKNKRQYFGLSDITGVDVDLFTFKGNISYSEEPDTLTNGFHLDSRLSTVSSGENGTTLTVDGISGYSFVTVSPQNTTITYPEPPIIDSEADMSDTIYSYVDLRKFTVYFYGGFDGWDIYRDARTNTDEFKQINYKGMANISSSNGRGLTFDKIKDPEILKLNQNGITSDWYAYLSAIRQFSNPEETDINVLATPGIDLLNNKLLAEEVIDMVEEERADAIYVATIPDKPYGADDYVSSMITPDDLIADLEATEINSNYTCTYYPWVKYYDEDNYQYINLPVTKDVVRNMALTDNVSNPWFAPAGISRGSVDCERAHYTTKLADEDVLYAGRVNPVKTFASDGVKLWGQKNLQAHESHLNRIAVRRLLLRMRKLVSVACRGLIFEPNDSTTKQTFLSVVTPILDNIKANRGITDYKIEVNDTVESRERRELPAKIFFKVIDALEYITLDFIITPEGLSFDNI